MTYKKSRLKKEKQLGMPIGTASAKLKKTIMFTMAEMLGLTICHRCGKRIDKVEEFSIDHKIDWLDSDKPVELFFDLENIAFSHLRCNVKEARQTKQRTHPSHSAYRNGCRCDECKEIERLRRQSQRTRGIKT